MPQPQVLGAASSLPTDSARLRSARVGDLLPRRMVGKPGDRRLDATAFVIPGSRDLTTYAHQLAERAEGFAAWDGRIDWTPPDGVAEHVAVVVDRYGQVYEVTTAVDWRALPSPHDLEEWFRFLATACPECGVIDDPRPRNWVP